MLSVDVLNVFADYVMDFMEISILFFMQAIVQ